MIFFRPSTLKTENVLIRLRVGYVCIEESFDTIFNMGYGGGRTTWAGKSPVGERVKTCMINSLFTILIYSSTFSAQSL